MFPAKSSRREILTCTILNYSKAENGFGLKFCVNQRYIQRSYNPFQIKNMLMMSRIPIEHAQKKEQKILAILGDFWYQTQIANYSVEHYTSGVNVFRLLLPWSFISALYVLCQKGKGSQKLSTWETKQHIKKPFYVFNCAHPGVIASAGRYEKPSTLCANIQNSEDTNSEQEQWHHVRVHTDTHPHESTNILHPLLVLWYRHNLVKMEMY